MTLFLALPELITLFSIREQAGPNLVPNMNIFTLQLSKLENPQKVLDSKMGSEMQVFVE